MAGTGPFADLRLERQFRGFFILALEKQSPDLAERSVGVRIVIVLGASRPQAFFVELKPFPVHIAEDHGSEEPVSDRQGLEPFRVILPAILDILHGGIGGLGVPEFHRQFFSRDKRRVDHRLLSFGRKRKGDNHANSNSC